MGGKRPVTIFKDALSTWEKLNKRLRNCQEVVAKQLLDEELNGKCRKQFLLRIHSRLNYLRAERERRQLKEKYRASA